MATPRTIAMSAFKAVGAASPASVARALLALALGALLAGCDNRQDLVPDKNMVAVPIGAVGHYGSGITITGFSINGHRGGGREDGWGGGLAGNCCVLLPRKVTKPMTVTVKWTTTRTDVDEFREHEATVPVNFAVQPEESSGLYVHFLPGHRVEVWVDWPTPGSSEYSGPPSPKGPAPPYEPLPDEKPRTEIVDAN